jgi:hypothetical protein
LACGRQPNMLKIGDKEQENIGLQKSPGGGGFPYTGPRTKSTISEKSPSLRQTFEIATFP